jgi:hypothetical protein
MSEHDTVLSTVSLLHQLSSGNVGSTYVSPYLSSAHTAFSSRPVSHQTAETQSSQVEDGKHAIKASVKPAKQAGRETHAAAVGPSTASNGADAAALTYEIQRNTALDKQLAAVKAQLKDLELKTKSLETQEQQRQADLRDTEAKQQKALSALQTQLSEANAKASAAIASSTALQQQLQDVTIEKENYSSNARRAEGEAAQALQRASAAESKLAEAKLLNDRSTNEVQRLQATINKLQADSKAMDAALAAAKTAKERAEAANTTAAAAVQRAEADRKAEELKRTDEQTASLQLQSQHRLQLAAKDATISELQGHVQEANAIKSDMARRLLEVETKGGERRGEDKLLQRELEALKATRDSLMAANRKLEKQAADHGIALTAATRHSGAVESQLAVLQAKWQSSQESNNNINTQKASAGKQAVTSPVTNTGSTSTTSSPTSYILLALIMLLLAANVAQYINGKAITASGV